LHNVLADFQVSLYLLDVTLALKTRLEFCRTLMAPKYFQNVPFPDYSAWIGATCWLPPKQATLALTRKQDTTKFYEAGKNGMPLLIIHGLEDLQVSGKDVVEQIQPKFTDCQVELLEGVGHIPFYE
jgi:pimeloyl-ACP methyl ester carboxylesterase